MGKEKTISKTQSFLMILYTHRSKPSPVIIREASCGSRWEQVQTHTARQDVERVYTGVSIGALPSELGEKGRKGCRIQRGWRAPGEHGPLNLLSRAHKGSQRLEQQA